MKLAKDLYGHLPNALTITRFVLIPLIVFNIIQDQYIDAFVFLTISGITDILDGFIARKFRIYNRFRKSFISTCR